MKFDDFDKRMRVYEQSIDQYIVPGMYIVATQFYQINARDMQI